MSKPILRPLLLSIIGYLCTFTSIAQDGHYFIQNYTPEVYKQEVVSTSYTNWNMIQDSSDLLYLCNQSGILTYDGQSWMPVRHSQSKGLSQLALGTDGRVYVCGSRDLGFIRPLATGQRQFFSLVPDLMKVDSPFVRMNSVISRPEGIYFLGRGGLYRWNGVAFKAWKRPGRFVRAFVMGDAYFVQDNKQGILRMEGDSLMPFFTHPLHTSLNIKGIFSREKGDYLFASRNNGLFLGTQKQVEKLDCALHSRFPKLIIMYIRSLPNGHLAIASRHNGVIIIDKNGAILQHFPPGPKGLPNGRVYHLYPDKTGGIWASLYHGLSRINYPNPLSYFSQKDGLSANVQCVLQKQDQLWVGTNVALYAANLKQDSIQFEPRLEGSISALFDYDGKIWLAGERAIYVIEGEKITSWADQEANQFYVMDQYPDKILVGLTNGLGLIQKQNGQWVWKGRLQGLESAVKYITETPGDILWLGYRNAYQIDFSQGIQLNAPIQPIFLKEGKSTFLEPFNLSGQLIFGTDLGLHVMDAQSDSLIPASKLSSLLSDGQHFVFDLKSDHKGQLWFNRSNQVGTADWDGQYLHHVRTGPLNLIPDQNILGIFPANNGLVWIVGQEGLYRYDESLTKATQNTFYPLIRRMKMQADTSLSFYVSGIKDAGRTIPYGQNDLRFEFGLPQFDRENKHQFSFWLEGNDDSWSDWQALSDKEFTNLWEGSYRFHLRAKNLFDQQSESSVIRFRIAPPWYRSLWAYGIYALILGVLLYFFYRAIIQRERKRAEIQIRLLEADQLKELDQIKSRFFANISHEFRTPLTLILGPLQRFINGEYKGDPLTYYQLMRRNGERLLTLINQLLDLSKLESGQMKLNLKHGDLFQFLRDIATRFVPLIEIHKLHFRYDLPTGHFDTEFDHDKLDKILSNLLSNAIKFTPENGVIRFDVQMLRHEQMQRLHIVIKDTGAGMKAEELAQIFERFYRVADIEQQGSGIGLALVKDLVDLHEGSIEVQSQPGQGTRFELILPLQASGKLRPKSVVKLEAAGHQLVEAEGLKPILEQPALLLIVEDNPDVRLYLKDSLSASYEILEASHGKQGLEIANERLPDLIITDVMMPEMDGFDFTEKIKTQESTSHIPVIMLTAKAGQPSRLEGLETGADAYLTKPFDPAEIRIRVRNLIEQRKKLRERFSREVNLKPQEIAITSADERFLTRVMDVVEKHMGDEAFSIEALGKEVGMSRSQLHRKIKALTDQSPSVFMRSMRLHRAMSLLEKQAGTAGEISYMVGFSSPAYFSKCFKDQFGISPSEVGANT